MSANLKFQLSRVIVAVTIPIMSLCLLHAVPAGMNGDITTVIHWFIPFGIMAALGIASCVAMLYYNTRRDAPADDNSVYVGAIREIARNKAAARQQAETRRVAAPGDTKKP